jgi:hypothetical protein
MIHDALTRAEKIDQDATAGLRKLNAQLAQLDSDLANLQGDLANSKQLEPQLSAVQEGATQDQLKLIQDSLPVAGSPAAVAMWWNSLTPQEREDLVKSVPVALYDLKGIPQSVRNQLRGSDGYDRVELVRWAEQNWNNSRVDVFPDKNENCANFVSNALLHAGLRPKGSPFDAGGWNEWRWPWQVFNQNGVYTPSWTAAQNQRDFFVHNGGHTVPRSQARPGDLIYFVQKGKGCERPGSDRSRRHRHRGHTGRRYQVYPAQRPAQERELERSRGGRWKR